MHIDSEMEQVQGFVAKGNYHAAYNIALSALNECRRNNNQQGVDQVLICIQDIVNSLKSEFGSPVDL